MKNCIKRNRILICILIIGLVVSFIPLINRIKAEENDKTYDLILDYSSLRSMAIQSKLSEDEWLEFFKSLGIQRIVLNEVAPCSFNEASSLPLYAYSLKELKERYGWDLEFPDEVKSWVNNSTTLSDALIVTETKDGFDWVLQSYLDRTDALDYKAVYDGNKGYIFIPMQKSGLTGTEMLELSIGLWPEHVERIKAHGLDIVPRSNTYDKLNGATFASSFIEVIKQYNSPYFLNTGDSLIGYDSDEGVAVLKNFLSDSGIAVGMFERNNQSLNLVWDGIDELLDNTGYNGIRVFNEWAYIQNRYEYCGYEGPEEITNSLYRAIAERNCRVVYLKMILEADNDVSWDAEQDEWTYVTDPEDYKQMITDLYDRLSVLGYSYGIVKAFELDDPSIFIHIIQAIAVVSGWIFLIDLLFELKEKTKCILLILASALFMVLAFIKPNAFKLLICMLGGIVMPSIAGVSLCRILAEKRRENTKASFSQIFTYSLSYGMLCVLICFGSSIFASSSLSELSYMIEMNLYRGVKIMQLIPIAIIGFAYVFVFAYEETGARKAFLSNIGTKGEKNRVKKGWDYIVSVLDRPMKLSWFVAILIIALACLFMLLIGVYYIYRTGNTTNTSSFELAFRNFLENLLMARPRTKEILIGWPCLMLFIWALRRKLNYLPLAFALFMSIGFVSIVNTFLHIHTPFLLSLLRTGWGILFGFIIGSICVVIAELIYKFVRKLYYGGANA